MALLLSTENIRERPETYHTTGRKMKEPTKRTALELTAEELVAQGNHHHLIATPSNWQKPQHLSHGKALSGHAYVYKS